MVYNSVKNGFSSYHADDNRKIMSESYFPAIYARLYKLEELSIIEDIKGQENKDSKGQEYKNVYY